MDRNPIIRKCLAIGIILLFVGTCIIPAIAQNTEKPLPASRGNWLYVGGSGPGNYTTIQGAINNANVGDTVFVYDDSSPYYEHVVINKSINLVGENKDTTVIDGNHTGDIIGIFANITSIYGFTIQNSGSGGTAGIEIYESNFCYISSCVIMNNYGGVFIGSSSDNTITKCSLLNNHFGVLLYETNSEEPVERAGNRILWNTIQYNIEGIDFAHGMAWNGGNVVMGNNISCNQQGMGMIMSASNEIAYNELFNNELEGIGLGMCDGGGEGNTIHRNNLILNGGDTQAEDGGGGTNDWDYNHWSDYNGSDNNGDGFGDTPYSVAGDSNAKDNYPLMNLAGWNNQAPNKPTISGSTEQEAGMSDMYYFRAVDSNGDKIFYYIDWGDGTNSGLIGPYSSNYQIMFWHGWSNPGFYVVSAKAIDGWGSESTWSSIVVEVTTITPPIIEGPVKGNVGVNYSYNFTSIDPENHYIYYYIDWGDGSNNSWFGPYESGQKIQAKHSWQKKGNYQIKAKAKDTYNNEGDWGLLRISMPRTVSYHSLFMKFLERFPHAFPILRQILGNKI